MEEIHPVLKLTDNHQIIFDAGSGFKNVKFSKSTASFLLFSHFHHDHIQGLPFNPELFDPKRDYNFKWFMRYRACKRDHSKSIFHHRIFQLILYRYYQI